MNFKKTVLYILLGIFLLIVGYNYILPYLFIQNNTGVVQMGRGRHMGEGMMNNTVYFYNNFGNILIVLMMAIIVFILIDRIFFSSQENKCKKCGHPIESSQWRICPRCGNTL